MEFFSENIHFHDACGAQYFSLDKPAEEEFKTFIAGYVREKGFSAVFDSDNCGFYVTVIAD